MKPAAYGSIREKKVNPDLQEEREKCNFDQKELTKVIYGPDWEQHEVFKSKIASNPELQQSFDFYDLSREELLEQS